MVDYIFLARMLLIALSLLSITHRSVAATQSVAVRWNAAALQGVHNSKLDTPMAARVLAIVDTCMYDAWAADDERAVGTQLARALRRPASERTLENKEKAISYAAYRGLVDVMPGAEDSVYQPLMKQLGYDPDNYSTDIETPVGIGSVACSAVLEFRHHDKSNQLGDLAQGAYSDWTKYVSVNMPALFPLRLPTIHPIDMNRWQPLTYVNSTGGLTTQMFSAAQWCDVIPFSLSSGDEFRFLAKHLTPEGYGSLEYQRQAEELVDMSANLTERTRVIAEYWSQDEDRQEAIDHWMLFAQWVSERDNQSLNEDVKMLFALRAPNKT